MIASRIRFHCKSSTLFLSSSLLGNENDEATEVAMERNPPLKGGVFLLFPDLFVSTKLERAGCIKM
jgi:hypothetical protein